MSEKTEYDEEEQAWYEAWSDNSGDDEASSEDTSFTDNEPDPESPSKPSSSSQQKPAPDNNDDPEQLKQKLRSAEGRLLKFEEHIKELREKVAAREQPNEPETPEEDTFLPEGWSKSDWEDFSADYPAQAELLEQQIRQVKKLTERVDTTESHISATEQNKAFEDTIRKAHPDYDDLLSNERQQIVDFIEGQSNPTLKAAYKGIYQGGTAEQIVELVSDYKSNGRSRQTGKHKSPVNKSSKIDNALAVPGRSQSPSNISGKAGMPSEDDFSGSWNYFSDDSF